MARRHGKVRARAEARCRERACASTCTASQPRPLRFVALPIALGPRVWSSRDVGVQRLAPPLSIDLRSSQAVAFFQCFSSFDASRFPIRPSGFDPYCVGATGDKAPLFVTRLGAAPSRRGAHGECLESVVLSAATDERLREGIS